MPHRSRGLVVGNYLNRNGQGCQGNRCRHPAPGCASLVRIRKARPAAPSRTGDTFARRVDRAQCLAHASRVRPVRPRCTVRTAAARSAQARPVPDRTANVTRRAARRRRAPAQLGDAHVQHTAMNPATAGASTSGAQSRGSATPRPVRSGRCSLRRCKKNARIIFLALDGCQVDRSSSAVPRSILGWQWRSWATAARAHFIFSLPPGAKVTLRRTWQARRPL